MKKKSNRKEPIKSKKPQAEITLLKKEISRLKKLARSNDKPDVPFTDVPEQKKAEYAEHQVINRYQTLFEQMVNGFALHEIILDKNGKPSDYRFLEVNVGF